ncbi:MAG: glycosyltransferase family 4 protein [Pirellulales bacterium]
MTSLRLLYVTRRFRPLPGGLENLAMQLFGALAERGHTTTVLTPRWQSDWPDETDYPGVRVVRLAPPNTGCRGEAGYARRLTKALRDRFRETDVVLVSGMMADAYTTLRERRAGRPPIALQPERPGVQGDCHLQIEARGGRRLKQTCFGADAFLALTPLLQRELTAAGYSRARIHRLMIGVPHRGPTDPRQKLEARRNLASADPALSLEARTPLVVYVGRLRLGKGLDALLAAWRRLAERGRPGMLWLVGEGPDAGYLREKTFELGIASSVRLTGAFDDVEDAFRAADVVVCPALDDGLGIGLLEAASYGLPVVAADVATVRDLFTPDAELLVYPKHDDAALADSLARAIDDPSAAEQLGAAAQARARSEYSLARMANDYEQLLGGLVGGARGATP